MSYNFIDDKKYESSANAEQEFIDRLIDVKGIRTLFADIQGDLTIEDNGVNWWPKSYPINKAQRALISDYVTQSLRSVINNLVYAHLNFSLFKESQKKISDRMQHALKDGVNFSIPPEKRPSDTLPYYMSNIHANAMITNLGSALDCLAIVFAVVGGLPKNITMFDLQDLRKYDTKKDVNSAQIAFLEELNAAFMREPSGWIEWLLELRNAIIHRPERLTLSNVLEEDSKVRDRRGHFSAKIKLQELPPARPSLSDIESFALDTHPVLEEGIEITLSGLMNSTIEACNLMCMVALDLWKRRKNNHDLIIQSKNQWPKIPNKKATEFLGYKPVKGTYNPKLMISNSSLIFRMQFSFLDDKRKEEWKKYIT